MEPHSRPQIPSGYTIIHGADGREYLVPNFMVPVTQQAMDSEKNWKEMEVDKAAGGVGSIFGIYFDY